MPLGAELPKRLDRSQIISLLMESGSKWSADNVPRLSAAVSFYAALSLAPFLIIGTVIAVYFVGSHPESLMALIGQTRETLGSEAGTLLKQIVQNAQDRRSASVIASMASFGIMFFSASNLFLQLEEAIRSIWGVRSTGSIVRLFVRSRLSAFATVIFAGMGLITWLYLDSRMAYLAREAMDFREARIISFITSSVVLSGICMFTMRRQAGVSLTWSDVRFGAILAAVSISIAKYLLSLYFANSGVGNVYGPAGALVVILLWIYYCSQIYFYGVEIVFVYAHRYGSLASAMATEHS